MNYAGCKRKFNVEAYIQRIGAEVLAAKKAAGSSAAAT
jgi:hypothetical protein